MTYLPFLSELQERVRASNQEVIIRSDERWSLASSRAMGRLRGFGATLLIKSLRPIPTDYLANAGGWLARKLGPFTSAHKIARNNIAAAYPDTSLAWQNEVLDGMWDHLGRFAVEYVHLDRLWDYEPGKPPGRIAHDPPSIQRMIELHESGKPVLIYSAHLANFELLGVASAAFGVNFAVVYRKLNAGPLVDELFKLRSRLWGAPILLEHSRDTSFQMLDALKGGTSLAMLVDQYHPGGVDVTFFGRRCKANPSLAKLARQFELPIHGARVVRLPGHRFRTEFTEPIEPARDPDGKINVQGTMQTITSQIESWVREHPEQWLWAHRRWR
ncbi:MAG: lipid A biosynthesis lauroyl acyltransferase [Hyphomicrobiales bacterium]